MEAEGVEREEDSWSAFPLPRNGPKRYYNYFTRTGIIKTETDASPGEKQARLECITLTVKTLSHARLVSPDFWRKFRVPFILPARPTFSLETKKENSNRNGKWRNGKWRLNVAYFMSILAEIRVTFDCLIRRIDLGSSRRTKGFSDYNALKVARGRDRGEVERISIFIAAVFVASIFRFANRIYRTRNL